MDRASVGDESASVIAHTAGLPKVTRRVPYAVALWSAPLVELLASLTGSKPIFTPESVKVLRSNGHFCHAKASADLGYAPRDPRASLADQTRWLLDQRAP